jgi:putative sterol carrier protein
MRVDRSTARPRSKGVTHLPHPPELRARAAAMLRAGREVEDIARELGLTAVGARAFLVGEEVRSVEATSPNIKFGWSVHTREEVIDRVEAEFARLDRLVSSLSDADFAVPLLFSDDAPERWTVKDALTHVTLCKEHEGRLIRGRHRPAEEGEPLSGYVGRHRSWRALPHQEVLEWHWQVHADYMRAVVDASDAEIARRHSWRWPAQATHHARRHRRGMERALLAAGRSIPRDEAPTPQQLVDRLCHSFNAELDPKLSVRIQLDIAAKGGGRWWLHIDRGECKTGEGSVPRPHLTISTRVQQFLRLRLGESNVILGAVTGTIKFTGRLRLGEALRVLSLFKPDYRWPNL